MMSKKTERVSHIVGVRNALNNTEIGPDGRASYDLDTVKRMLATLDAVLTLDNILPVNSRDKVNS